MDYTQYPKTRSEAKASGATHYYTGEPCKHGHIALRKTKGACVECIKIEWEKSYAKRAAYFEQYNKSEAGQQAKKKYYAANKDIVALKALTRPNEDRRKYRAVWAEKNPLVVKANTKHRRSKHKLATPKWLTPEQKKEIKQMYIDAMTATRVTGVQYVVDHKTPLRHPDVCGLHVPWNLQIMTRAENLKKSNKLLAP
jgi:hypothetical protein